MSTTTPTPVVVTLRQDGADVQIAQYPGITIRIAQSTAYASPAGRLAEIEIIHTAGPLAGLRLIGFALWERRSPSGRRNVTFPARTYSVNGERRSFALLRPVDGPEPQDALRDAIVSAYEAYEQEQEQPQAPAPQAPPTTYAANLDF